MSTRSNDLLETHGKKFKFARDFGHGVEFDYTDAHDNKVRLRTVVDMDTAVPREASLDVRNLLFSFGAVHHYAYIKLDYPKYVHADSGERYRSGVSSWEDLPFGVQRVELEIMRPVDRRDIKHDKDMAEVNDSPIYGRMRPRDWTHGFWSEEEAKAAAIKFFQKHFAEGWILVPESYEEDVRPVYASTVKP